MQTNVQIDSNSANVHIKHREQYTIEVSATNLFGGRQTAPVSIYKSICDTCLPRCATTHYYYDAAVSASAHSENALSLSVCGIHFPDAMGFYFAFITPIKCAIS